MDINTDRIANLLLATAKGGDLARELRSEIEDVVVEILDIEDVGDALNESVTAFVEATIDVSVAAIVASRGEESMVAAIVGTAFATALSFGIAIGTLAEQAAEG